MQYFYVLLFTQKKLTYIKNILKHKSNMEGFYEDVASNFLGDILASLCGAILISLLLPAAVILLSPTLSRLRNTLTKKWVQLRTRKVIVSGILNQGESLPIDGLKFQFDELFEEELFLQIKQTWALISILDGKGNILKKEKVHLGYNEFKIKEKLYRIAVLDITKGSGGYGSRFIDISIREGK